MLCLQRRPFPGAAAGNSRTLYTHWSFCCWTLTLDRSGRRTVATTLQLRASKVLIRCRWILVVAFISVYYTNVWVTAERTCGKSFRRLCDGLRDTTHRGTQLRLTHTWRLETPLTRTMHLHSFSESDFTILETSFFKYQFLIIYILYTSLFHHKW